jgi:hypothetical protein
VPGTYTSEDNFWLGGGMKTDYTVAKNCFPGRLFSEDNLLGSVINHYVNEYIASQFASHDDD